MVEAINNNNNINVEETDTQLLSLTDIFMDFINNFRDKNGVAIYKEELERVIKERKHLLIINYKDLKRFNETLAKRIEENPESEIDTLSNYIHVEKLEPIDYDFWHTIGRDFTIGIIGYDDKVISPSDKSRNILGRLVTVEGIVAAVGEKKEFTLERAVRYRYMAVKEVMQLSNIKRFKQDYLSDEPIYDKFCEECNKLSVRVEFVDEEATKTDWSIAILQDKPEKMKEGQVSPGSLILVLTRDLADMLNPGDIVKVTGYLRTRKNKEGGKNSENYYFVVTGIEYEETPFYGITLTQEDIRKIEELRKNPKQFMKDFIDSIAPSVYGLQNIKEAVALSLVGSYEKILPDTKVRPSIHILVIGEPGVGKTMLLRAVQRIAPKSIYVSGESATKVGLSAGIDKDPNTGEFMVQAGALALADGGFTLIDEIDKLNPQDIPSLREAMQDQVITLTKIKKTRLNARTTVIAAGNPKGDIFPARGNIFQYIDISKSILTRFDLIFTVKHELDRNKTRFIYDTIITTDKPNLTSYMHNPPFDDKLMKKIIVYARSKLFPKFTDEAKEELNKVTDKLNEEAEKYPNLKRLLSDRVEGSLTRLSVAYARLQLKNIVEVEDVRRAFDMLMESLESLGVMRKEEEEES